ncbi:MAG: OmpH family outer membrane protein [Bacteroidales bacterium]|nr:OmpH family outer membrane protein [Bacteroidales bacterium]MCB9013037.1 OmpH family outer membrane protein [Bacteroidales bacterium]
MKNLNTILIIVLIIAVGVLYAFHFTGKAKTESKNEMQTTENTPAVKDANIAYINIDTLLVQMDMYTDLQTSLEKKRKDLESTFQGKVNTFQKNVADLQNKVNKGLLTRAEAEERNQQLGADQQQLEALNNTYTQQLQEEGAVSQRKVIDFIMEYLKEYNADKNINFVFSYTFGGNLLYMNNAFDITNDILKGVNEKYQAEKPAVKK